MSALNENDLREILSQDETNVELVKELVDSLTTSCCDRLDAYVDYVRNLMNDRQLTNPELDDVVMTIPTLLYYVGTKQEELGIRHDVSKAGRNQVYNQIYTQISGTAGIEDASAKAELFNEDVILCVYARAYNIIKSKIDSATELLQSAKKVISRRMSETELSNVAVHKTNDWGNAYDSN